MKTTFSTRLTTFAVAAGLLALTVLVGCQSGDSSTQAARAAQAALTAEPAPAVSAGSYTIDPAHSEIGFRVKHLGLSTVRGIFNTSDASITFPEDDLSSLQAEATIEAASLYTGEAERDDHLRSADFFHVEQYPNLTFKTTGVENIDGSRFTLNGDLTIRGVTKPVALDAEYVGTAVDPWGNERVGFTAEGTIDRKEYGLTWNKALEAGGFLVGDEVTLVLDVQAIKKAE